VSEPNVTRSSCSAEPGQFPGWGTPLDAVARTPLVGEQLTLHLGSPSSGIATNPAAPVLAGSLPPRATIEPLRSPTCVSEEGLIAELGQLRSLTQDQLRRIHSLEQALDQALALVRELRQQVVDQEFLETQLASTEEISNVQQQAIIRLKLQLAQQQQDLEAQLRETQARDHAWQDLLSTLESLTETQQAELERLRNQLSRDRAETQANQTQIESRLLELQAALSAQQQRVSELEAQALSAQGLMTSLDVWLDEARRDLRQPLEQEHQPLLEPFVEQLDNRLQQLRAALQDHQLPAAAALPIPPFGAKLKSPTAAIVPMSALEQELAIAQVKIEELETQIAKQLTTEAMLQHLCQQLELERDRQQARMTELERQTADMQEQILRQAQQASEYETAVQHWKDRYLQSGQQMQQLKELVERLLPDPPAELTELLSAIQSAALPAIDPVSPALFPTSRATPPPVDLPDFLLRRRNKARRS
jgi:chromosome segregation ATPase